MKTMTSEEWNAEGVRRFGEKARHWKFKCAKCQTVQSGQDWINAGTSIEDTKRVLGFSCIGRKVSGKGCDWTLGGLFKIHTLEVLTDSEPRPCFEFAEDKPQ